MFESFEECSKTERLTGLVLIHIENGQAKKVNQEQIVEDFVVHKAQRITFRHVSTIATESLASTTTVFPSYTVCKTCTVLLALI